MDSAAVIAAAREQTGLVDYGDPAIVEGLDLLCRAYETEAKFNPRGRGRSKEPSRDIPDLMPSLHLLKDR